ncbi:hypothetical protein [Actinomadura fibrosa]|uniref:DUF1640 domain-containing protein n=1 Tax=Actinomadura fibrosa TaxID=111802 RepID=A0ABW2XRE5_9ACTN|nr:hypothetical protein [Actinomadura fibrosa]
MSEEGLSTIEIALLEMRRDLEVRLTNLEGQLALLHQRNEQSEREASDRAHQVGDIEDRLGTTEREQITRSHLDNRFRHTMALLSLIAASASAVIALLTILLSR